MSEGGEEMGEVAQRGCGSPVLGGDEDQVGCAKWKVPMPMTGGLELRAL